MLHVTQALEGFLLAKRIEGLSSRTLEGYERQIEHLADFLGDPPLETVTTDDLRQFFDYLRNEYTPKRLTGNTDPLSDRTIRNYWIALRSFYSFATQELDVSDHMAPISAPKVKPTAVTPLEPQQVKAMLDACMTTKDGRRHPNAYRNRAILAVFADVGLRVTELTSLTMGDYDSETGRIDVRDGKSGDRVVFLGAVARKAVWRYLVERDDKSDDAPLFAANDNTHLSRSWVRKVVSHIGEKAGVSDVHPHRMRHFFAIQYLRNSGDIFTLQRILGHHSLRMVRHYSRIADVDARRVHRIASPVDHL